VIRSVGKPTNALKSQLYLKQAGAIASLEPLVDCFSMPGSQLRAVVHLSPEAE
jgi:hypothetical protein